MSQGRGSSIFVAVTSGAGSFKEDWLLTTTASHAGSRTGEIVRNVEGPAAPVISFQNISRAYRLRTGGELLAVAGLTFEVRKNEVLGLLGPNGAGKTTLLKMLTTLLYPTAGSILVDGLDVQKHGREVRARIGWVPANRRALSWKLTGEENLQFLGAMRAQAK